MLKRAWSTMVKTASKTRSVSLPLFLAVAATGCDDDGTTPLGAPAQPSVQVSAKTVDLSWSAVRGAQSYIVERATESAAAAFAAIGSGLTTTSYRDTTVVEGAAYRYRVVAVRGSEQAPSAEVSVTAGRAQGILTGAISATRQLSADTLYLMQGIVSVEPGGALRIPPGTEIRGDVNAKPTALLVKVGGRILAEGTREAPIVFTSSAAVGKRRSGDWGGVLIAGDSYCSFDLPCRSEGVEVLYGGTDAADDSGVLRYVRIEFAGFEATPGNELNGLGLFGVGSGTVIENIQVHRGSDDGIELFGGTVNVKRAIVTGSEDDSFDYSTGWQGKGQFWIAQQYPGTGDRGFEVDGNEKSYAATPLTRPSVYNVTLIGQGATSSDALQLRRGTAGEIRNLIVAGFGGGAMLDVDNAETVAHCSASPMVDAVIVSSVKELFDSDEDDFEARCAGASIRRADPMLTAPLRLSSPDFRPAPGSPALTGAAAPPADGFFEAVDYLGAAAPGGAPWYEGWITTAAS